MEKILFFCDVCRLEGKIKKEKIQVIFTTEQTEGRPCKPHLSMETIDICKDCKSELLQGNYLYGSGAQGYNKYQFNYELKKLQHHRDSTVGLWATDRIDLISEKDKEKHHFFEITD